MHPGAALAVLALAGCGGARDLAGPGNLAAFQALQAQTLGTGPTPLAEMPSGGTAVYAGYANLAIDPGSTDITRGAAIGAMDLGVAFGPGSGTLSGGIGDFEYFDGTPVAGSVAIRDGVIAGNLLVSAEADGTVGGLTLDMTAKGSFVGNAAGTLTVFFEGTSSGGASGVQDIAGVAIGLRE